MVVLKQLIFSFMSTLGFAILFNAPKNSVYYAGFVGSIAWSSYFIFYTYTGSNIISSFIGALVVGLLGEVFARRNKKPATLYITAGIIPLVPGAGMYYTMLALIEKDFTLAANKGFETFFLAVSISIGIIFTSIFSRSIKRVRKKTETI